MKLLKPLLLLLWIAGIGLCGAEPDGKTRARDVDAPADSPVDSPSQSPRRSPRSRLPETSAGVPEAASRVETSDEDQEDEPKAEFAAGF